MPTLLPPEMIEVKRSPLKFAIYVLCVSPAWIWGPLLLLERLIPALSRPKVESLPVWTDMGVWALTLFFVWLFRKTWREAGREGFYLRMIPEGLMMPTVANGSLIAWQNVEAELAYERGRTFQIRFRIQLDPAQMEAALVAKSRPISSRWNGRITRSMPRIFDLSGAGIVDAVAERKACAMEQAIQHAKVIGGPLPVQPKEPVQSWWQTAAAILLIVALLVLRDYFRPDHIGTYWKAGILIGAVLIASVASGLHYLTEYTRKTGQS